MKYLYQEIKNHEGTIMRGVVNTPDDFDQNKKYKTVIFFHGLSGDRNGSKWFRINNAKYLTKLGYLVVRFDFSGTGESDGEFYDMTLGRELKEAEIIVDFVKNLPYVENDSISWYGHSLGGLIASLLAEKLEPKSLILLAPASDLTRADFLIESYRPLRHLMDESLDYRKKENREDLKNRIPVEDYDFGGIKIHKNFFADILKYDTYEKARKYDGKVLIMRGSKDDLIDEASNKRLEKAFKNATYEEIKDTDHSFTNQDAREIVFDKMGEFLSKD